MDNTFMFLLGGIVGACIGLGILYLILPLLA